MVCWYIWDFVRKLSESCSGIQCDYIDFHQDFHCPGQDSKQQPPEYTVMITSYVMRLA
jgi:hypothetical protein